MNAPAAGLSGHYYLDTNGDGVLSPVDVQLVINHLNAAGANNVAGQAEGEADVAVEAFERFSLRGGMVPDGYPLSSPTVAAPRPVIRRALRIPPACPADGSGWG